MKITLIPGDGIGPEVTKAATMCIDALKLGIEWETVYAGSDAIAKYGSILPEQVLDSIRKNKVALKGPMITPIGEGFRSVNVAIRQALDLFACVRPAKSIEGVPTKFKNIDIVIFRENTEDLYAGIEFEEGSPEAQSIIKEIEKQQTKKIRPDSAISIKPISISGSQRIINAAFDYARVNKRKKVTLVHKANIMKYTDGLFLKVGKDVAKRYPDIVFEDAIVDNLSMQLVKVPQNYDVLVLPNLYGDIISDLCAGLIGGLGVAPGANIGGDMAVFEAVHGAAPKYKDKNMVNPTAMIMSGVLMLDYIGKKEEAKKLEQAVRQVIKEGKSVTYDLKENRNDPTAVGTKEMAEAICKKLQ
ncbi:MAG: isocitrate/isopropylmalate dehydrogenase family protein [Candidatus Omnitrophota bacterium]